MCVRYFSQATVPYFGIRSQGQDTTQELAGWTKEIHLYRPELCEFYVTIASTSEYTDSFESKELTCLPL